LLARVLDAHVLSSRATILQRECGSDQEQMVMLPIQLERSWNGLDGRRIGPVDGLRINGASLRILPLDVEILRLVGDRWRMDEEDYAGLTIESPTLVYVERSRRIKGRFYGPFDFLRVSQREIYTSNDRRLTLARYSPLDRQWHVCHDGTHWPRMLFFPSCRLEF
jgi:hypothetical protein